MNWLRTIWEIEKNGGNSTVQVLWEKCFKLYPEKNGDTNRWVSKSQLEAYHEFQSNLWEFLIDLGEPILWCNKIRLRFLNLSQSPIYEGCDIKTREKINISEVDYVYWLNVWQNLYELLRAIQHYFLNDQTHLKYLWTSIYSPNIKVTSIDRGIWEMQVICTDVFWDIPWTVDSILSKK